MIKIRNSAILRLLNIMALASATRVMAFACLVIHVLLGRPLTPEITFTVLSLCNSIKAPITYHISNGVGLFFEALVSIKRVQVETITIRLM